MEYPSLPQRLLEALDRFPSPRTVVYRTVTGWKPIGSAEFLRRIANLSRALAGLGVKSGDRVALLATNCPEWHIADFAAYGVGAAVVPIYFNESLERMAYILNDSSARVAFACGEEQVRRLIARRSRAPKPDHLTN